MTRACAILAVYNEADIIREAVEKLIAQEVDVYLIDNMSSDATAERVADLVGRGLIDIEQVRFEENGREIYDWTSLLKRKEAVSRQLDHDWFLHVDADEIRYAPWPGVSLREGIERVDAAGYNLINFKLFNFRLTADTVIDGDFESAMTQYSGTERFNQRQVKAWKAHPAVNIAALGGHHIVVPDARVYPTRFIHKHYPVRSLEHGRRKILAERKARFSTAERQRGWHVQYNHLAEVDAKDVYWNAADLSAYLHADECLALLGESSAVLSEAQTELNAGGVLGDGNFDSAWLARMIGAGLDPAHARQLLGVARQLAQMLSQQDLPPIGASADDAVWLRALIGSFARMRFLGGDPGLYGRLGLLRLG